MLIEGWIYWVSHKYRFNQCAAALMQSYICGEANMPELADWFDPEAKTGSEPKYNYYICQQTQTQYDKDTRILSFFPIILFANYQEGDVAEVPSLSA